MPSKGAPKELGSPVARILWRAALEKPSTNAGAPAADNAEGMKDDASAAVDQDGPVTVPQELLDFDFVDDINGRTALHEAASAGRLPLVAACLEKGVSVAQADVYGRQPLHYAAMNGCADVCQKLLEAGASPSTPDLDGYSPMIYSITNGWTEVVETFLAGGVSFETPAVGGADQLNALSLACQYGHEAIARLLLERGAKILPDPAGYWPQHLAAREGHAGVLRLLVDAFNGDAAMIDAPDKYSQSTPLSHAASEGHAESVKVLLAAGADVHAVDEFKRTPIHYAAWQGHIDCVNLLIDAGATLPPTVSQNELAERETAQATASTSTMDMDARELDLDGDLIPDLSLPPPIIPFHIYGHAYLGDAKCLVHITLGHPNTTLPPIPAPVRLYDQPNHGHPPSLKLVITPKPDSSGASIPHSVILPLADEREVFSFQVDTLSDFSLEFDLFPTFGSKMIGKAVAVASTFADLKHQGSYVVPIVDPHLKVIGDIPFEINVVKPFGRAQLQIGGQFETYWKSTATLNAGGASAGSNDQGPSVVTASSLSGEHVRIVVQVTSDGHPVAWPQWKLPVEGLDVFVGDVTLQQLNSLAKRLGKSVDTSRVQNAEDPAEWYQVIAESLVSLEELLSVSLILFPFFADTCMLMIVWLSPKLLPASLGVNLEIRYPTRSDARRLGLARTIEVNDFVDCVLSTVYRSIQSTPSSNSKSGDSAPSHRRIVLSSFNPIVCTALNWKQPNFSVFFASYCGLSRSGNAGGGLQEGPAGRLVPANRVEEDRRCTSIREAVKFAKSNNLLGIMLDATMLVRLSRSTFRSTRLYPDAALASNRSRRSRSRVSSSRRASTACSSRRSAPRAESSMPTHTWQTECTFCSLGLLTCFSIADSQLPCTVSRTPQATF